MAYYGDDFTGSTDALEALTRGGVETVLFVEPPTAEQLRRYPHIRAVGVAGNSRATSPAEMDALLPGAFQSLRALGPKFVHYKVCSTFDSSPEVGSIGRAIDVGCRVFENRFVPLVAGVPVLRRYCVFGNLFASSGLDSPPYRLDRHPTMRHHPVTPMTEADLRLHLARQTDRPMELLDVLTLEPGAAAAARRLEQLTQTGGRVALFDTLTDAHLATIGRLLGDAQQREQKPLFITGSSGVEYALTAHWRTSGATKTGDADPVSKQAMSSPQPVERALVISGSCSPVTERQIAWALHHGFAEVPLDTAQLMRSQQLDVEIAGVAERITRELDAGRSVVVHTSRGPNDARIAATREIARSATTTAGAVGGILGRVLRQALHASLVRRVAVTGGDTSGSVARSLGIEALEMVAPFAPGAPLCVARSSDACVDGVEITFKGGQVGHDDLFGALLSGRGGAAAS